MQQSLTSRRGFLTGSLRPEPSPVLPPGADQESMGRCTGCGECATACPTGIILVRRGKAEVDYEAGECTFCGICAEQCPEPVFPATQATSLPYIASISQHCLALNFVDCQVCRDGCQQSAIQLKPYLRGMFRPEIVAEACNGCGACVGVCPSNAIQMMNIEVGNV